MDQFSVLNWSKLLNSPKFLVNHVEFALLHSSTTSTRDENKCLSGTCGEVKHSIPTELHINEKSDCHEFPIRNSKNKTWNSTAKVEALAYTHMNFNLIRAPRCSIMNKMERKET